VRNLFLFAVLTWMTGNPILALVLVFPMGIGGALARLVRSRS